MFEQISSKLQGVIKTLRGHGRLTEAHVDTALRELRLALLEADVHFGVVRDFVSRVREKAVGQDILASLSAPQQVLRVMRDEMIHLLGDAESPIEVEGRWPAVILMTGLSGSGKTTTSAKVAKWLAARGRHPALVSADVRRPAAIEQLKVLADRASLKCIEPEESADPVARTRAARAVAADGGFDVLVVDTAGRLHVDPELMEELKRLVEETDPTEVLFVADSMTGQDAVRSAQAFAEAVPLTGHVLTKLDGDARGGAALSLAATTKRPIKLVGIGEKLDALEPFHPDRMASRILGMGDVLTLIERAERASEDGKAEELARKLRREELSLEDFRVQLKQLRRMGSLNELMDYMPSLGGGPKGPAQLDEAELGRFEAILSSMTPGERLNASIINGSRRRRIAKGSGCAVSDVNRLLRRFVEARKMVKTMARSKGRLGKMMARMR